MKERLRKLASKGMFKRYLAGLLTVITFITAIPLSNLTVAKAVDEYNYSLKVTVDLDGGITNNILIWRN